MITFTHGAGLDAGMWEPQIHALRDRHQSMSWDVPTGPRLDSLARDLLARSDPAGVIHVGHSFGGDIVQRALMLRPRGVLGAVLVGCLPIGGPRGMGARVSARLAPWRIRLGGARRFRQRALSTIAATPAAAAYASDRFAARSTGELAATWEAIGDGIRLREAFRAPCPVLLVVGAEDQTGSGYLARGMEAWAETDPRATLVRIPGAAHLPSLDAPDAFNDALTAFADECASG